MLAGKQYCSISLYMAKMYKQQWHRQENITCKVPKMLEPSWTVIYVQDSNYRYYSPLPYLLLCQDLDTNECATKEAGSIITSHSYTWHVKAYGILRLETNRSEYSQRKIGQKSSQLRTVVLGSILTIMSTTHHNFNHTSSCQSHHHVNHIIMSITSSFQPHQKIQPYHHLVANCNRSGTREFRLVKTLGHETLGLFGESGFRGRRNRVSVSAAAGLDRQNLSNLVDKKRTGL